MGYETVWDDVFCGVLLRLTSILSHLAVGRPRITAVRHPLHMPLQAAQAFQCFERLASLKQRQAISGTNRAGMDASLSEDQSDFPCFPLISRHKGQRGRECLHIA